MKSNAILLTKVFIIILFVFIIGCSKDQTKNQKSALSQEALSVTLFKIKSPQEIVYELEYPGKTKSAAEIKVVARVSGILREVYFKEGSYVNKGVLLGVVEREPYKISYDQAKAQLEKAQVELQRAEKDWVRVSNAFRDRLVSEAERDKALYDFEMAKAKVKEAQSNLSQAELNLRYTEIRAEIEGILGKKFIDAGNLVSPGTPITSIIQIKPLEIEFSIPERDLAQLGVKENPRKLMHKRVELHIDNFGAPESATIFFVDSKFDETSSLKVKALYPNKGARLLPEMFLRVKVRGIPQRAILVPQKMVLDSPRGTYVFIVEGNKTKIRPIKIVASYKDYYVVESGVRTDDLIVADNLVRLRPDMPVKIEKIIEETP